MASTLGDLASIAVRCAELFLSATVHVAYAGSVLWCAVLGDACTHLASSLFGHSTSIPSPMEREVSKLEIGAAKSLPSGGETAVLANSSFFAGHGDAPVVLVHGIFGFGSEKMGSLSYWAGAEHKYDKVFVPDLGPLTSMHDRARELFYFLKGGRVDYGQEHSLQCGHSRFGRTYSPGHYPEWDENHPVHFVGHSTGAQVVRVLQQMLADKKFEGYEECTNADWVLSLTSLSGVLNGTTRIYLDGIKPEDGRSLATLSLLQLLRISVVIYEWMDIPYLKRYYGFGFDHYDMSWRKIGLTGLLKSLLFETGPFASHDWICSDLSIQSSVKLNRQLQTFPNTFYFSYATQMTKKFLGFTVPTSMMRIHPVFCLRSLQMCQWRHPSHVSLPYQGYRDEDWHDNDGALNTISMLYPLVPIAHPNCQLGPDFKDGQSLQTGIWYHTRLEGDHIFFIINRERAGIQFDLLYTNIFHRCAKQMRRAKSTSALQI